MKLLILLCFSCLLFGCTESVAQEVRVLDFEYFKYGSGVFIVATFGTTDNDECFAAAVIRCVYKNGEWVPSDDVFEVPCEAAQNSLSEIRNEKKDLKKTKFIKYSHFDLRRASVH